MVHFKLYLIKFFAIDKDNLDRCNLLCFGVNCDQVLLNKNNTKT